MGCDSDESAGMIIGMMKIRFIATLPIGCLSGFSHPGQGNACWEWIADLVHEWD